jgi:hypothetical protein
MRVRKKNENNNRNALKNTAGTKKNSEFLENRGNENEWLNYWEWNNLLKQVCLGCI